MTVISCSREIFAGTIARLRRGGLRGEERAVLWLAKTAAEEPPAVVCQLYEPEQIAAKDFFHLPPESMRALMMHLRTKRLKVVAQIHTHPGAAFHSDADNEWAIVRHRGALSLVFPRFAEATTVENFLSEAVVYELSNADVWEHVRGDGDDARIQVTP